MGHEQTLGEMFDHTFAEKVISEPLYKFIRSVKEGNPSSLTFLQYGKLKEEAEFILELFLPGFGIGMSVTPEELKSRKLPNNFWIKDQAFDICEIATLYKEIKVRLFYDQGQKDLQKMQVAYKEFSGE